MARVTRVACETVSGETLSTHSLPKAPPHRGDETRTLREWTTSFYRTTHRPSAPSSPHFFWPLYISFLTHVLQNGCRQPVPRSFALMRTVAVARVCFALASLPATACSPCSSSSSSLFTTNTRNDDGNQPARLGKLGLGALLDVACVEAPALASELAMTTGWLALANKRCAASPRVSTLSARVLCAL